jgi:hypothetical protein
MTKKRTRQSTRRQAKKLEIPRIETAILNTLGRDLAQFLEEQRQQTSLDLFDQSAALDAVTEEQNTRP